MNRNAHSHSWPPGVAGAIVAIDRRVRPRRIQGLQLIAVAASAWSLGFAATDWLCDQAELATQTSVSELEPVMDHLAARPELEIEAVAALAPESTNQQFDSVHEATQTPAKRAHALRLGRRRAIKRAAPPLQTIQDELRSASLVEIAEPAPFIPMEEAHGQPARAAGAVPFAESASPALSNDPPRPKPTRIVPREAPQPRTKVASIEAMFVAGALTPKVVARGVARLLPSYARCGELAGIAPERMEVSASIDEAGRGRQVAVEGLSEAALRGCLERATAYLALPAPDTGTARARWVVRFVANAEKSSPTREPRHIAASTSP